MFVTWHQDTRLNFHNLHIKSVYHYIVCRDDTLSSAHNTCNTKSLWQSPQTTKWEFVRRVVSGRQRMRWVVHGDMFLYPCDLLVWVSYSFTVLIYMWLNSPNNTISKVCPELESKRVLSIKLLYFSIRSVVWNILYTLMFRKSPESSYARTQLHCNYPKADNLTFLTSYNINS